MDKEFTQNRHCFNEKFSFFAIQQYSKYNVVSRKKYAVIWAIFFQPIRHIFPGNIRILQQTKLVDFIIDFSKLLTDKNAGGNWWQY